jgi:muramoyltetrapeptide carboxypeptidase
MAVSTVQVQPGDLVRLVAPGSRGEEANLALCKAYIESLGLVAKITDGIYGPPDPFYSNTDEFRAKDLTDALTDPECKIIWCIRGGIGSIRLIPFLDSALPVEPPSLKILIGFSDITALHLYLIHKYNWPTIHGPTLEAIATGVYDPEAEFLTTLKNLLFNSTDRICEPVLTRLDSNGPIGPLSSQVTGGNMSLVGNTLGTSWAIKTQGKILFFENTRETGFDLEGQLNWFVATNMFDDAAAVVFGDFTEPDDPQLIRSVMQTFAASVRIPVFVLEGIGHGLVNFPLPLNTNAQIVFENGQYLLCV